MQSNSLIIIPIYFDSSDGGVHHCKYSNNIRNKTLLSLILSTHLVVTQLNIQPPHYYGHCILTQTKALAILKELLYMARFNRPVVDSINGAPLYHNSVRS